MSNFGLQMEPLPRSPRNSCNAALQLATRRFIARIRRKPETQPFSWFVPQVGVGSRLARAPARRGSNESQCASLSAVHLELFAPGLFADRFRIGSRLSSDAGRDPGGARRGQSSIQRTRSLDRTV